jgi:hypothetical protein
MTGLEEPEATDNASSAVGSDLRESRVIKESSCACFEESIPKLRGI